MSIPVSIPDLRGNEAAYLQKCVEDNWVSSAGPFLAEFEEKIAALSGARHAISTCNGTSAIYLALRALGVGQQDVVLVPDWTFSATVNAVLLVGAVPHFVDIHDLDWGLSPERLRHLFETQPTSYLERIKAIVPVHALGHPADMDPIVEVARSFGVFVVEDAAGALGSEYAGRHAGTIGDAGIFSFNGNKLVTAGGGGIVVTNDDEIAERVRLLSSQGRTGERYQHADIAFNFRMTNLNAAVGLAQLERFDEMLGRRQAISRRYRKELKDIPNLSVSPQNPRAVSNEWMSAVRCSSVGFAEGLVEKLQEAGIGAGIFWESLSQQEAYAAFRKTGLFCSQSLSGTVVSLPCSSNLTDDCQTHVIDSIRKAMS